MAILVGLSCFDEAVGQAFCAKSEELKSAHLLHRKAQWRLDMVNAENSRGFHAPHETYRVLSEAIDFARQGQLEATKAGNKLQARKVMPPDNVGGGGQ